MISYGFDISLIIFEMNFEFQKDRLITRVDIDSSLNLNYELTLN